MYIEGCRSLRINSFIRAREFIKNTVHSLSDCYSTHVCL